MSIQRNTNITKSYDLFACYSVVSFSHQVLKYCPKDLQADICVHLNRVILENNPAFHKASIGALRAIARNFWICHVAPGDRVVHTGESLDVLYFIAKGSLEVKQNEAVVGLLGEQFLFEHSWQIFARFLCIVRVHQNLDSCKPVLQLNHVLV